MFQQTQNNEYIQTITRRIESDYLTWCEQFLDIIEQEIRPPTGATLNDIGCNVGQFYKSLKKRRLPLVYRGLDVEPQYLEIARRVFPEISWNFELLDVEKDTLPPADLNVISATMEHLQNPFLAFEKVLAATRVAAVIRTFLGSETLAQERLKPGARLPYVIRQFRLEDLAPVFRKSGFEYRVAPDRFTASQPVEIEQGIVRCQHVIVLTRQP